MVFKTVGTKLAQCRTHQNLSMDEAGAHEIHPLSEKLLEVNAC